MEDGADARDVAESLLLDALEESRRLGFLGARPIDDVVVHARHFVGAIAAHLTPGLPPGLPLGGEADTPAVLDLGSGGGVPGLVIAHDLPSVRVTLLDRRRTRTDFLARVVRRLDWADRVDVVTQDAARPSIVQRNSYDAVVARGFGPPATTLRVAARWVRPGGVIAISEPPSGDRWSAIEVAEFDVELRTTGPHIATFVRH